MSDAPITRIVRQVKTADRVLNGSGEAGTFISEQNAILVLLVHRLDTLNATMKLLIKPTPPRRDPNEPELGNW